MWSQSPPAAVRNMCGWQERCGHVLLKGPISFPLPLQGASIAVLPMQ